MDLGEKNVFIVYTAGGLRESVKHTLGSNALVNENMQNAKEKSYDSSVREVRMS